MSIPHFNQSKLRRATLLVLAVQLALLVAAFGVWTWQDFSEAPKKAGADLDSAGLLLEERVLGPFSAIDGALLQTADLVKEVGLDGLRSEAAWKRLQSLTRPLPATAAIFVYDSRGDAVASSVSRPPPVFNAANRRYFQILISGKAEKSIGKALKGETVHECFFPIARSIKDSEGRTEAVAQVGVEVDRIADYFNRGKIGSGIEFGLYRLEDGALVVRRPMAEKLPEETIASRPFFGELAGGGSYWSGWTSPGDSPHLLSARRVGDLPLILTASMARGSVFAPAYDRLPARGLALLVSVMIVTTLGVMLISGLKREARVLEHGRLAEQTLLESEGRLRLFIEHAPAALAMFDRDMRYISASRRWLADYNLGDRDVAGLSHYEVFPEIREEWKAVHQRGLAGEVVREEDDRYEREDGSVQRLRWEVRPWNDASGNIGGIVIFAEDVTDRKRAEEALREREREFVAMFERASVGKSLADPETGRMLRVNQAFADMLGYSIDEMCRMTFMEITHPEDRERDLAGYNLVRDGFADTWRVEKRYVRKDGSILWGNSSGSIIRYQDGRPPRTIAVIQDITERKRAEEALRRREEELRTLVENAPDVISLFDRNLRRIFVNSQIRENTGMDASFLRGKSLLEAGYPESFAQPFNAALENAFATGREETVELDWEGPKGRIWLHIRCAPLRSADGSVDRVMSIGRDITERKRAEEVLRQARDELEMRVRERTAQLEVSNKALVKHAVRLEALNEELQDFAFVAAHDLQEPLRKIQTFSGMLSKHYRETLGEQGLDYLVRMTRSAQRMSDLLRSLLNYSRIVSQPNPFEVAELGRVVDEAVSDLEMAITMGRGSVEIGDLPSMEGDVTQLRQLFQNLISNSIKFSRAGKKPLVKIHGSISGGMCRVVVQDNGIGFDQQYIDRIFKPFQRLHGRDAFFEGTGMGLAICKKIVERHGGSITATSAPGRGASFIVTLPTRQRRDKEV
jgi:PAS domain S-box-containing protein